MTTTSDLLDDPAFRHHPEKHAPLYHRDRAVRVSHLADPGDADLSPAQGGQVFFKSAFYLPVVTSGVVLSLIWLYLYDPAFGLLNFLLGKIGIEPVLWLCNPQFSLLSIVIMFHASHWGGSIILLTASMGGIPKDLYEAARLDGACSIKQSIPITIPLLKPAITYVAIIGTIASLQIFTEIFLMTRGGPNYATTNLVFSIYEYGFIRFDFGRASAVAVILLLLTIGIAIAQFRLAALECRVLGGGPMSQHAHSHCRLGPGRLQRAFTATPACLARRQSDRSASSSLSPTSSRPLWAIVSLFPLYWMISTALKPPTSS